MGTKITALAAAAALTDDDIIPVVDAPGGTAVTKSATVAVVRAATSGKAYGGIYAVDNTTALTLTLQNTWYQFVSFTGNMSYNGTTPDYTTNKITIATTGDYKVFFQVSFSGTANHTYCAEVYTNSGGTEHTSTRFQRKLGSAGDIGSASGGGYISLTAGDTVELWMRCTSGAGNSITGRNVQLMVELKK